MPLFALLPLLMAMRAVAEPLCKWPYTCPGTLPYAMKQTYQMNLSTIIMPCNDTGFTDPQSTKGWGIVDFDWSNGKGTGSADGWVKHKPMDDEEMLFQQVKMTTEATAGTTVWVYRCTVYGYPWYTDVRKILEDAAYDAWWMHFRVPNPYSPKCDSNYDPPPLLRQVPQPRAVSWLSTRRWRLCCAGLRLRKSTSRSSPSVFL